MKLIEHSAGEVIDDEPVLLTNSSEPIALEPSSARALQRLDVECRLSAERALADSKTYASLAGSIRQIARDYRDRAIMELIQNAHDAHPPEEAGEILVRLIKRDGGCCGELHVANRGVGFVWDNVDAIRYPAQSTKKF